MVDKTLSTLTVDYNQSKSQLQTILQNSPSEWKAVLPTETGDTIVSLVATIHATAQQSVLRAAQDVYPDTAVADSAIYAAASMQGVRINRKLPASITVEFSSEVDATLSPFTTINGANTFWFNRDVITIPAGSGSTLPAVVSTLYQGLVNTAVVQGLGSDSQLWVSPELGFFVSDLDTQVRINGVAIQRYTNNLWDTAGSGYLDKTLASGAFAAEFGNGVDGSKPEVSDIVTIDYVVTNGAAGNSVNALNKQFSVSSNANVFCRAIANPTGGSDQTPALRYKNIAAYSFGTFNSAVVRGQYQTTILQYPGVQDGIIFAQKDVNASDPRWMNLMQVSVLPQPGVEFGNVEVTNLIRWLEERTQFSGRFIYVPPEEVISNVEVSLFCFSWASLEIAESAARNAITTFFNSALLNYDITLSDLYNVIQSSYSGIEYIEIITPTSALVVSTPALQAPTLVNSFNVAGALTVGSYAYGVGYTTALGQVVLPKQISYAVIPNSSVNRITVNFQGNPAAVSYQVYGRGKGTWGVIANLGSTITSFVDNGTVVPVPSASLPDLITKPVRYNSLGTLKLNKFYSTRPTKS